MQINTLWGVLALNAVFLKETGRPGLWTEPKSADSGRNCPLQGQKGNREGARAQSWDVLLPVLVGFWVLSGMSLCPCQAAGIQLWLCTARCVSRARRHSLVQPQGDRIWAEVPLEQRPQIQLSWAGGAGSNIWHNWGLWSIPIPLYFPLIKWK